MCGKKIATSSLIVALALAEVLILLWLLAGPQLIQAAASTRFVAMTGNDSSNDCTNYSNPCRTVQYAVDQAASNDVILIATGVYTDVYGRSRPPGYEALVALKTITQVVYISKTVAIRGGYTTAFAEPPNPTVNPTTLNAEGKGRIVVIAGYISPTIEGLRLIGGNATALQGEGGAKDAGGGVYVISATATLSHNQIISNTAYSGGGVYLLYSNAILDSNAIISNTGGSGGGGGLKMIYSDNAVLRNNFVATNTARSAGGLFVNYSNAATLVGNTIVSNTATIGLAGGLLLQTSAATVSQNIFFSNTAATYGGGLYLSVANGSTLSGNTVTANSAYSGGGLELDSSDAALISNTIRANTASDAALVLYYSNATLSDNIVVSNTSGCGLFLRQSNATLTNTVVADNRAVTSGGCGLYIADGSLPRLVHTTIARNGGNQGTGVHVTAYSGDPVTVVMTNTILVSHTRGIYVAPGDAAILESTLWGNTNERDGAGTLITGTHNYGGDPRFAVDGYHLLSGSAAIDKGVNAEVTSDVDGDLRPQGGGYDLGADEFTTSNWRYLYLPLILR